MLQVSTNLTNMMLYAVEKGRLTMQRGKNSKKGGGFKYELQRLDCLDWDSPNYISSHSGQTCTHPAGTDRGPGQEPHEGTPA